MTRTLPQKKASFRPKAEKKRELSSIGEIFAVAWQLYKKRALAVMLLAGLFSGLLLAGIGIGGIFAFGLDAQQAQQFFVNELPELQTNPSLIASNPLFLPLLGGGVIIFLAAILLAAWQQTAVLAAAVDEHKGIVASLCTGWKYLLPMLWVSSLYFGIVTAGLSLLILPGLMLALSMSFCFCVMLDEERTGIDALIVSRLYVRGRWWNTMIKMAALFALLTALTLPIQFFPLFLQVPGLGIAVQLLSWMLFIFALSYTVAIYRDLKETADIADPDASCRCFWRLMAAAGLFLPLLGLIGAAVAVGPKLPGRLQELRENLLEELRKEAAKQGVELPIAPPERQKTEPEPDAASAPEVRAPASVDGFLVWRDPAGDTADPLLDITEVSADGEDGALRLGVTVARPFAEYFAAQGRPEFALLLSVQIDTDMNPATGDAPSSSEGRSGYDLGLEVRLAGPSGDPAAGRAYASLHRLAPQQRQSLDPLDDSAVSLNGRMLHIRLPYERLNAAAGGSVRVCFQEASQPGGGLSKDQIVPLK